MNKTLVLLSGGMDSSVALALAMRNSDEVQVVSFNYGQRHVRELQAAEDIAGYYNVKHTILDLTGASKAFEGSALTGEGDVPEGHYADENMKKTVVPNRNCIMLSLAAGLAISQKLGRLVYAAHAGDFSIYPDCRVEFVTALASAIQLGNYDAPVLQAPFVNMSKADIAHLGASLHVPFEKTWSCYVGADKHCATCGTCQERRAAFQAAGVPDLTLYDPIGIKKVPKVTL